MSNGWGGVDPASFVDASDYELGTHYLAVNDVTITHVRVFGGTGSTFPGRVGRIWSAAGSVLASVSLPSTITPGWNTYALTAPLVITAGTDFWVTYSTVDAYGFLGSITYPVNSADGNLRALGAGFHNTPTNFPDTPVTTGFFGIDVTYTPGASGNQRPTAGLTVDVTGPLQVQANVTITDESPGHVLRAGRMGRRHVIRPDRTGQRHAHVRGGRHVRRHGHGDRWRRTDGLGRRTGDRHGGAGRDAAER
jgi:hypothetical protein